MVMLLLVIIYLSFIGVGLPASLLGAAWPVMYTDLGTPLSYGGIISMIIIGSTIVSCLLSERVTRRLGAGPVTAIGLLVVCAALFGFSVSNAFWMLCLWAVPFGLGSGAIDAAVNNYVALRFGSRHMNWLHFFWGVGATISPYIIGYYLIHDLGWALGYRTVGFIQICLTLILFVSLPLWKKQQGKAPAAVERRSPLKLQQIFRLKGILFVMLALFGYGAVERTAILWASSYLVEYRGINTEIAAQFASLVFLGITIARFVSGFIAAKVRNRDMIRAGMAFMIAGIVMILLPVPADHVSLAGLVLVGCGCAPIFPSILHSTPGNFGAENSQAVIGVQMASAYTGAAMMPYIFGWLTRLLGIGIFPVFLLLFAAVALTMSEMLNRTVSAST